MDVDVVVATLVGMVRQEQALDSAELAKAFRNGGTWKLRSLSLRLRFFEACGDFLGGCFSAGQYCEVGGELAASSLRRRWFGIDCSSEGLCCCAASLLGLNGCQCGNWEGEP